MIKQLIIVGASGHGKVVADIAIKMKRWERIVFLEDDTSIKKLIGLDVVGTTIEAIKYKDKADFFVAIGNNETRKKVQENFVAQGLTIVTLIHPNAVIGIDVEIGIGTVIMAGVVINSSTRIGNGCIINTCSSVDHDNEIKDYVHLSPGVSTAGNVTVNHTTWLGIGSVVSNNVSICSSCKVGACAAVIKDISEPGLYVGVPARKID